jgi:hypothetical protein
LIAQKGDDREEYTEFLFREGGSLAERLLKEEDVEGSSGTGAVNAHAVRSKCSRFVPVTGQFLMTCRERVKKKRWYREYSPFTGIPVRGVFI